MTLTLTEALAAPGLLIYRGPSVIDGSPIAVIVTLKSDNAKLGGMAQTWIIPADVDPIEASRTGADASVCGDCAFRGIANPDKAKGWAEKRGCYVNLLFRPLPLWKALQAGRLLECTPRDAARLIAAAGLSLRAGAYGDPAAAPDHVHGMLIIAAHGHTAYSHQWRNMPLPRWAMASADSLTMAQEAWGRGFRTFRVIADLAEIEPNEVLCPASEEAGKRTTCAKCQLCQGRDSGSRKSIAIVAHGGGGAKQAAKRLVAGVAA